MNDAPIDRLNDGDNGKDGGGHQGDHRSTSRIVLRREIEAENHRAQSKHLGPNHRGAETGPDEFGRGGWCDQQGRDQQCSDHLHHADHHRSRNDAEEQSDVLNRKPLDSSGHRVDGDGEQGVANHRHENHRNQAYHRDEVKAVFIDEQQVSKEVAFDIGRNASASDAKHHQTERKHAGQENGN